MPGEKGLTIHLRFSSLHPDFQFIHKIRSAKKKKIYQSRKINDKRVLIQCIKRRNRLCLSFLFIIPFRGLIRFCVYPPLPISSLKAGPSLSLYLHILIFSSPLLPLFFTNPKENIDTSIHRCI